MKKHSNEINELEKYRFILENISELVMVTDFNGVVSYLTPNCKFLFGYSQEELVGTVPNIVYPGDNKRVQKELEIALNGKRGRKIDYRIVTKDGRVRWINHNWNPVFDNGKLKYVISVVGDITEKKKSEIDLIREKKKAENYLNLAGNIIMALDSSGHITLLNKRGREIFGCKEDPCELIGKNWFDCCLLKKDVKEIREIFDKLMRGEFGSVVHHENVVKTIGGDEKIISWYNTLLEDDSGKVVGVISSGEDITERKDMERDLRSTAEKFSNIFNLSPILMAISTMNDGVFINVNETFLKILGYSREDVIGRSSKDLNLFLDYNDRVHVFNEMKSRGFVDGLEIKLRRKDGKVVVGLFSVVPIRVGKKDLLLTIAEDITEKKKAEKAMIESEEKYRLLFETAKDGILLINAKTGEIEDVNPYLKDMLGYSKEEFVGKQIWQISPFRDIVKNKEKFLELQRKKYVRYEDLPLEAVGGRVKYVEFVSNVYRAGDKMIIQANIRDITDRKKAQDELKQLNSELDQRVKNRTAELERANVELRQLDVAKNDFLNMVSHELKTPLTSMIAHLDVLVGVNSDCMAAERQKKQCGLSIDAIRRGNIQLNILIDNLLEVARMRAKTFKLDITEFDIKDLVLEILNDFISSATQKNLKIKYNLPDSTILSADKNRIREIFSNLINNAIKFTEEGEIVVGVDVSDDFVSLFVSDTGRGIMERDMPKLFSKFFQVEHGLKRGNNSGTGLGLTIVNKLTHLHGGRVFVKSQFGVGSTFVVKLPMKTFVKKSISKQMKGGDN